MIPKGRQAIAASSPIVNVRLSVCRDFYGNGYPPYGWHPFTSYLLQIAKNPRLPLQRSALFHYMRRFAPKSMLEAMTAVPRAKLSADFAGLPNWPPLPWTAHRLTPANDRQHFGPLSRREIKHHALRCRVLYEKIRKEGYLPDRYPDGYIKGYFLRDGKRYRFIVTAGQHRMAVLAALGYKTFNARIQPKFPRVVDVAQAGGWMQVTNGTYTRRQAELVFRLYFQLDGTEKARRLGLL